MASEKDALLEVFRKYDRKGDGAIDQAKLCWVLQELDSELWTKSALDEAMSHAPKNKQGKVMYEEFINWIFGEDAPVKKGTSSRKPREMKVLKQIAAKKLIGATRYGDLKRHLQEVGDSPYNDSDEEDFDEIASQPMKGRASLLEGTLSGARSLVESSPDKWNCAPERMAALTVAIKAAKTDSVDPGKTKEAESLLELMTCINSLETLIEESEGDDAGDGLAERLRKAIADAEVAKVVDGRISRGRAALERVVAEDELCECPRDRKAMPIAIAKAVKAGVNPRVIDASRKKLQGLWALELYKAESAEDVERLEAAIEGAREAGTEEEYLEQARKDLERIKAGEELCELKKDRKALPGAIEKAESLGVDQAMITAAKKALQGLWALELHKAEAAEDVERLHAALNGAKEAGVEDEYMVISNKDLAIAVAEEALCTFKKDRKKLPDAIARAEQAGVKPEMIAAAKKSLKGLWALELHKAEDTADVERLQAAIKGAKEAGVDDDYIDQANKDLGKIKAGEELCDLKKDRKALPSAIEKAENLGVDPEMIAAAKKALQGLWAMELYKAEAAEDVERLHEALAGAKEAGVEDEYMVISNKDLAIAVAGEALCALKKDRKKLPDAIAKAEELGVKPEMIAAAKKSLKGCWALELHRAGDAEDTERLQAAITGAKEAGVDDDYLEQANKDLARIIAQEALCDFKKDRNALPGAIAKAEQAGVNPEMIAAAKKSLKGLWALELHKAEDSEDVERLQSAINGAKEAGVDEDYIEQANKGLAIVVAGEALCTLKKDRKALPDAIAKAEEAGVKPEMIAAAKKALQGLWALELHKAGATEDIERLQAAIKGAQDAGVDEEYLQGAREDLARLEAAKK